MSLKLFWQGYTPEEINAIKQQPGYRTPAEEQYDRWFKVFSKSDQMRIRTEREARSRGIATKEFLEIRDDIVKRIVNDDEGLYLQACVYGKQSKKYRLEKRQFKKSIKNAVDVFFNYNTNRSSVK